jgi:hypothetical protein
MKSRRSEGLRRTATRNGLARRSLAVAILAVGFLLAGQSTASAVLQPLKPNPSDPATFSGRGGVSTDGLGQVGTGGTIQAEVPAGSTVQQAYLYGIYYNGPPSLASRTIDFDGTTVVLELTPTQSGGFPSSFFYFTARAT